MKRIILITLAMVFMASPLLAAPFLVCDPQAGVTDYKLTGPAWVPISVTAQPDGSIKMDVASSTVGNNSLTVAACKNDAIWGELCSEYVPFDYTRPSGAALPGNLRLSK
jgi:hypothetical protein